MDFNPDQFGVSRKNVLSASSVHDGNVAPLDWPGLSARLAAAHAARLLLAGLSGARASLSGSFAPTAARDIATVLRNAGQQPSGFHHAALTQSLKPIASRDEP